MKTDRWKSRRSQILVVVLVVMVSVSTFAQTRKPGNTLLQLGDTVDLIPPPDGFEEAASQFFSVDTAFTETEAPGNDMLAVHLLTADCETLRRGGTVSFG